MVDLCFSTYAKTIKNVLKEIPANEAVADLLFNSIAIPVSLENKIGEPFGVTKETASKLFNRSIDVPRKIRQSSSLPDVISSILSYFEKSVVSKISPGLEDDLLLQLTNIINNDANIPGETKKQFLDKAQKNTLAEFLANVFLYSIKKGNKLSKIEASIEIVPTVAINAITYNSPEHSLRLLVEAKGYCPNDNCNEPLFLTKNGRNIDRYKATQIRSELPVDSFENLIALCPKCHDRYLLAHSHSETDRLAEIKASLVREAMAMESASEIKIESEINEVLRKIVSIPQSELIPLDFEPVMVVNKISKDNSLLLRKTLFNVSTYFNYIKDVLKQMSKEGILRSDAFSMQVKLCYIKERDNGLSQQEIYDAMVEWLRTNTNGSRDACDIVISYFVQNCEVFDAITE